ncbi:hypothetical protein GGF31_008202 [Allomyces arbusculus]|nr:hypothetical protein GGF31_008202 [Allomyces arbusculus]
MARPPTSPAATAPDRADLTTSVPDSARESPAASDHRPPSSSTPSSSSSSSSSAAAAVPANPTNPSENNEPAPLASPPLSLPLPLAPPTTVTFVHKVFHLLDDPVAAPFLHWGTDGDCFVVPNFVEFARHVLPLRFKHCNFASFVRQCNMYGFTKVAAPKPAKGRRASAPDARTLAEARAIAEARTLGVDSGTCKHPSVDGASSSNSLAVKPASAASAAVSTGTAGKQLSEHVEAPWIFRHPLFKRGHPELLDQIQRKRGRPPKSVATTSTRTTARAATASTDDPASPHAAHHPTTPPPPPGPHLAGDSASAAASIGMSESNRVDALRARIERIETAMARDRAALARLATAIVRGPGQAAVDLAHAVLDALAAEYAVNVSDSGSCSGRGRWSHEATVPPPPTSAGLAPTSPAAPPSAQCMPPRPPPPPGTSRYHDHVARTTPPNPYVPPPPPVEPAPYHPGTPPQWAAPHPYSHPHPPPAPHAHGYYPPPPAPPGSAWPLVPYPGGAPPYPPPPPPAAYAHPAAPWSPSAAHYPPPPPPPPPPAGYYDSAYAGVHSPHGSEDAAARANGAAARVQETAAARNSGGGKRRLRPWETEGGEE